MIHQISTDNKTSCWQNSLRESSIGYQELCKILSIPCDETVANTHFDFKLKVTPSYLARIEKGNPNDPLLLQILPKINELDEQPIQYTIDPVGDTNASKTPGLLHKYQGRVLLTLTGVCAIHCRYCFRRNFDYASANPLSSQWENTLTYLKDNKDIEEVILSGGDPLSLNDEKLKRYINDLETISHLTRLRIHTRQPIVLPNRVTKALIDCLQSTRLSTVIVLHINHPNELNAPDVADAMQVLKNSGLMLYNQSVLLKDINDCVDTLTALSKQLINSGIQPYYLHLLDKVKGAAHFDISENKALDIYGKLETKLPGYMVPKLVREIPGKASKTIIHS